MIGSVHRKTRKSKLSTSRLRIENETETTYEVRAYNFLMERWFVGTRHMEKSHFHKNYEPEIAQ